MNETLKRSISGAIYVIILIASILYSTESFFILFGIFLIFATIEFSILTKINKIIAVLISSITYALFYKITFATDGLLIYLKFNQIFDLVILSTTIIVLLKCIHFLFDYNTTNLNLFSKYIFLIGYITLPFVIITKIPFGIAGYNPKILISIFILIWTNDSFAYIVGKSIGKHKLFEKISPKKTIEGFFGGLFFSVLMSYFIAKYFIEIAEAKMYIWITIALIVSIFGTIGDLVESKFKRIANVKDSGKIMPGHGGVLDRLDSVIFVAPIVFLFYQILNYVS